ncbi:MAG: sulfotransferase [Phycisphaerales bacterium]|nr:sulfotransferase [Phycisphaerales bacterium]
MPRAGTQAMMRALNADPRVAAFGETLYWGRLWIPPDEQGKLGAEEIERIAHHFENNHLVPAGGDGSITDDGLALGGKAAEAVRACTPGMHPGEVFASMCQGVLEATGRTYWVEKTPHHLQHLDRILRFMPEARILVMLRSPASFLRSYKHQGDRKDSELREKFHRLYHPALASLVGRGTYRATEDACAKWPGQVMVVRLEELIAKPADWMPRIRAHLELPADAPATYQRHNSSFEHDPAMQADLTRVETTWLRLVLGKDAQKLDFELPPRRFAPIGMLVSVCALFPWVVRNWSFMSQHNSGGVRGMIRRWLR